MRNDTRVIVVKDGVPKELHNLEEGTLLVLENAYMAEPVVGISQELFQQMTELLATKVAKYRQLLDEDDDCEGMFARSIAFAKAMEISSQETPVLFDCILWIDRMLQEREEFTSRDINLKAVKCWTRQSKNALYKEFNTWARDLFKFNDVTSVGIVKFLKYFGEVAAVV